MCVRCEGYEGGKSKQVSALAEMAVWSGESHKSPGYSKAVSAPEGKVHGAVGVLEGHTAWIWGNGEGFFPEEWLLRQELMKN